MTLKIKKEHYDHMQAEITRALADAGVTPKELREEYTRTGLSEKRLRWDAFHAAKLNGFLCSTLYLYLDDSHVDSALKQIVRELEGKP